MTYSSAKPVTAWLSGSHHGGREEGLEQCKLSTNMLQQDAIVSLSDMRLIQITGANSKQFLQGQLSCDINNITETNALPGTYCDHKGRMIVNFFIFRRADNYFLILHNSLLQTTLTHIKKYAQFSKVECSVTNEKILFITGEKYTNLLSIKNSNEEIYKPQASTIKETTILNFANKFAWIIADKSNLKGLLNNQFTTNNFSEHHQATENIILIEHNIPIITEQTSLSWTPAMIGWTKNNAVSFKKGCFVGQEVIARTHNLGKEKRHLYKSTLNNNDLNITAGEPLSNSSQTIIGKVSNSGILDGVLFLLSVIEDRSIKDDIFIKQHKINSPIQC